MQKGNIGVTTENIFPVIKKFLYSDHEIFLRELVSNAVDATQKLKTLSSIGEFKGEVGDLTVHVSLGKDTITVSDHGIGLTAEEIDKYINQIAFSGANDFLEKYKNDANAIIGHFGLGFYSAFMVAKKVEIITKSYREGAQAVKWTCDGSPEFTIEDTDKAERGTDIVLYIDDDCKEFLEEARISSLLKKYCSFLPIPVAFGKKKEWKDGKQVETAEDNIINDSNPLWTLKPSELKDEDYKKFYRDLYPMSDEPLFWIHLNVDYPFHLTGILYFPKVKSNIELNKNKIQLYCNQVYVTDSVEGIVPDFLTLLHGVLDSPDIPLNVSRSYLQSDANVKKISTYITKKVSDRLQSIFKNDRKQFEEKWNDLKIFINYGMLTQEDFYDRAKDFALFTDTDSKYYTFEEYKTLIKDNQTDKDGNTYSVVTTEYTNYETAGKLSILKKGEQLTDYKDGAFVYEEKQLDGVTLEVYAAGDIVTQDNQRTKWFAKGDLVSTITTGKGATFTSDCAGLTGYQLGENGMVTVSLPLGKYRIKETKTLYGYILADKEWNVEFNWKNKEDAYVLNSTAATDDKGVLNIMNERARSKIRLQKRDGESQTGVSDAVFGIYTKDNIYNAKGISLDSL